MSTRIFTFLFVAASLLMSPGAARAGLPTPSASARLGAERIKFVEVASGLNQPLYITHAGDGSGRLFIVERGGQIRIHKNGSVLPTAFLDVSSAISTSGSEQGLLSIAFHPNYENNGRFYTIHTDRNRSIVLSVFTRSAADPDRADPGSRVTLLTIPKTFTNHNGGTLAFGPDGYLYWSTGDGGGAGDPENNAQNLESLLGKILRLDVSSPTSYSIPPGNPYYNFPAPALRQEIWAYGLRNPWRFSFDRLTGDMYIGDVGQTRREEIDFQPAGSTGGENYGWRVMEGSLCYSPGIHCLQAGKVLPVAEYDHSMGCSVTGGHVYRGNIFPHMYGHYLYGDFCSGLIFALKNDPSSGWTSQLVAETSFLISTFGEDERGELYVADYGTGRIHHIVHVRPPGRTSLNAPSGAITDFQPRFSWNEAGGTSQTDPATWYQLWVNGPSGNEFNRWYPAADICSGGVCSVLPNVVLRGGDHTWWVRAWNPGGHGPWSDGLRFSLPVPTPPLAATPLSPSGAIKIPRPAYSWTSVEDSADGNAAAWYQLWVNGPSANVLTRWYRASDVCSGGVCSVTPDERLVAGDHSWWVRTWNSGGYGPWSHEMNFTYTVPQPPVAAVLQSPTGAIITTQPSYVWSEVVEGPDGDTAAWYYLWVNDSSGNILKQWYEASAVCSAGTCSVTPALALTPGTYRWWIQTWNYGGHGPWSSAAEFSLSP